MDEALFGLEKVFPTTDTMRGASRLNIAGHAKSQLSAGAVSFDWNVLRKLLAFRMRLVIYFYVHNRMLDGQPQSRTTMPLLLIVRAKPLWMESVYRSYVGKSILEYRILART